MSTPPPPPAPPPAPTPPPPPGPAAAQLPKKRRSGCWVAVLVGCGLLVLVAVVVAGIVGVGILWVSNAEELVPTEADRAAVVTIDNLHEVFPELALDPGLETLEKLRYPDESVAVDYEYDDETGLSTLYMTSALNLEVTQDDAEFIRSSGLTASRFGATMIAPGEVSLEERDDLFRWGDESTFILVLSGDEPVGNVFFARKGMRVVSLLLIGAYVDDSDRAEALLGPVVRQAETHGP